MSLVPKGGYWTVPREWVGERCFIICGGPSVRKQRSMIAQLRGRVIAVKQSVILRPDADVMFVSGKDDPVVCAPFFPQFRGTYLVARSTYIGMPDRTKTMRRTKLVSRLSEDPRFLAGLDGGTSAINLAYLFGATEIILLGYDMTGGRWFNGEIDHHMPFPPQHHFDRHMKVLPTFAADLHRKGIRVVNVSPISAVKCFERAHLQRFL